MNAAWRRCPTLFAPMRSGDGLLVRVKPPGAVLPAAAARVLARAAARDGNGTIELTNRASLQVRGLTMASAPALRRSRWSRRGSPRPIRQVEHRRMVIAAPLADATDMRRRRRAGGAACRCGRLAGLPAKFGFLVDGGGGLPLDTVSGDVRLRAAGGCWHVWCDGARVAAECGAAEAVAVAIVLAEAISGPAPDRAPDARRGRFARPAACDCGTCQRRGTGDDGAAWLCRPAARRVRRRPAVRCDRCRDLCRARSAVDHAVARGGDRRTLRMPRRAGSSPTRPIHASHSPHVRATRPATTRSPIRAPTRRSSRCCCPACARICPAARRAVRIPRRRPSRWSRATDGYALVRDGRAGDAPARTGLALDEAAALLRP